MNDKAINVLVLLLLFIFSVAELNGATLDDDDSTVYIGYANSTECKKLVSASFASITGAAEPDTIDSIREFMVPFIAGGSVLSSEAVQHPSIETTSYPMFDKTVVRLSRNSSLSGDPSFLDDLTVELQWFKHVEVHRVTAVDSTQLIKYLTDMPCIKFAETTTFKSVGALRPAVIDHIESTLPLTSTE